MQAEGGGTPSANNSVQQTDIIVHNPFTAKQEGKIKLMRLSREGMQYPICATPVPESKYQKIRTGKTTLRPRFIISYLYVIKEHLKARERLSNAKPNNTLDIVCSHPCQQMQIEQNPLSLWVWCHNGRVIFLLSLAWHRGTKMICFY